MVGEYWKKLAKYFQNGNLPWKLYAEMPESLKERYRKIWRGKSDHIHGRPRSPEERKVHKKQQKKAKQKKKAAKQARKRNR